MIFKIEFLIIKKSKKMNKIINKKQNKRKI